MSTRARLVASIAGVVTVVAVFASSHDPGLMFRIGVLGFLTVVGSLFIGRGRRALAKPRGSRQPAHDASPEMQELLVALLGDRAKAERLIDLERQRSPTSSRATLIRVALERLRRDNQ